MQLEERALEILTHNEYINIATITPDGRPWNTPVYAVYDKELNFYWSSWKKAEHSANIRANGKLFITVYDSTRIRGDNNRRCLYLEGTGSEIEAESEIEQALTRLYGEDETDGSAFLGASQRRVYKATLHTAWLNDKSERQVTDETLKMRIEVSLERLCKLI